MKLVAQRTPVNATQCMANRDALAKQLFDNLFSWLVKRMNKTILPEKKVNKPLTIGLLDIFGF